MKRIVDEFVDDNRRALAIYDNLDGQSNEAFRKCSASVRVDNHFGLPGGTHLWQVVDDGIGIMLKKEMGEVLDEMLCDDEFLEEWASGVMPAWRVRVLTTQLTGVLSLGSHTKAA